LFTKAALIDRFEAAKRQGFKAVEIQFPYSLSAETLRNILEQQQLNLVLFNVAAGDLLQGGEGLARVPEKREQFRQAVTQALEYAQLLKPEVINILPGRCLDSQRQKEYLDTEKSLLRQLQIFLIQALMILNMHGIFIDAIDRTNLDTLR